MAHEVVTSAHVNAQPTEVFAQWLSADALKQWWWPEFPDASYTVDGREGGEYAIESQERAMGIRGRFETVDEPNRIELTWTWLDHGMAGPESHVRVDFDAEDGGTRITVTHDVVYPENVGSFGQGWDYVLGNLAYQHED